MAGVMHVSDPNSKRQSLGCNDADLHGTIPIRKRSPRSTKSVFFPRPPSSPCSIEMARESSASPVDICWLRKRADLALGQVLGDQREGAALELALPNAPWHSHSGPPFSRNFRRLVLGCIKTDFYNQILILQDFSRSTRFTFLCTAPNSNFQQKFIKLFDIFY